MAGSGGNYPSQGIEKKDPSKSNRQSEKMVVAQIQNEKTMIPQDELLSNLAQFSCTTQYYKHWLKRFVYTDGVQYLAEAAKAYWLIDAIASHQPEAVKDSMLKDFQIWKLKVAETDTAKTAELLCERDTDDVAITQHIDYTDFPLPEIKMYLESGVLMLPSER